MVVVVVAVVVVLTIVIVHNLQANHHQSQVRATYDKCLNEPYPDGPDCQTIVDDCANGDSYACYLVSVLACGSGNSGSGCNNTGGT